VQLTHQSQRRIAIPYAVKKQNKQITVNREVKNKLYIDNTLEGIIRMMLMMMLMLMIERGRRIRIAGRSLKGDIHVGMNGRG
jgi:hypothetical protein